MNEIHGKLKLILWGKNLQLPEDYDNLKFDKYELEYNVYNEHKLYIYKNNKLIKYIWYWKNKNKGYEFNYKNKKENGKQYAWYCDGNLYYKYNYKNGIET